MDCIIYPFDTCEHTICSTRHIRSMTSLLLARSMWFSVMPLPDDKWKITIKDENEAFLLHCMNALHGRIIRKG